MKTKLHHLSILAMVFFMICSVLSPLPAHAATDSIRIGTYNIAAGTKPNIEKMNTMLSTNDIDVVGVQEVDYKTGRNDFDMLDKFAQLGTFVNYKFQKSIDYSGGEYGIGQLSRLELKDSKGGFLNSEGISEARAWQRSIVEKNGKQIAVYNTHLTHENVTARQRQLSEVLTVMDNDPTEYKALTGDFNTDSNIQENYPFLENYNIANGKGDVWFNTYNHVDATMNVKCIDNVITSRNLKVTDVQMVESDLSDHNLFYIDCEFLDEKAPSKELMNFLVKDAEALNEDNYSTDSYAVLAKVIEDTNKLGADATQVSIDMLVKSMRDAILNLKEARPDPVNLALNKAVEVSTTEKPDEPARFAGELAVDGIVSNTSRWSGTKNELEQWLEVDLGEAQLVNKIVLNLSSEAVVYNVYISEDGTNYEPVLQIKDGNGGANIKEIEFDTRQVRYIKYEQKEPCPQVANGNRYSGSIFELEAYYDETLESLPLFVNDSQVGDELHEFNYQGNWKTSVNYPDLFYGGDEHWFNFKNFVTGDELPYLTMKFKGNGIELYGNNDKNMGIYEITIDDLATVQVDPYAPARETQKLLFSKKGLPYGEHTVKLKLTNTKNAASSACDGELDFAKVFGVKEEAQEKGPLVITPTPRKIDYKEQSTAALDEVINIVTHQDIAENSLNRLKEALEENGHTYSVSENAVQDKTNIVLMPNANHCDACRQYLADAGIEFNLQQAQASLVDVKKSETNTNITVISKDIEGLYYGIVNVEALLQQKNDTGEIYEVAISDYPNLGYRGFIEGFFGPPWKHEGRLELLEFSGQMKMNRYIYGPKDDPYHRTKWREDYPENLGKQISELASVSEKNNVEFTWAVHTTLGGDTIDFDSEKDRTDLLAKFESMYDLGVRSFSMFFDDISDKKLTDPNDHADLANYINQEFIRKKNDVKPLSVVPYEYSGIVQSYLTPFGEALDEDIVVLWVGSSTCPDTITKQDLENMKAALGREVMIWWNYPVNDYWYDTPGRLFLGPVTGLDKKIDNTYGILSNPMSWESASQIALHGLADFTWNPDAYDAQENWEKSVEKLVPDYADEMKLFAKNSSHLGTTANMKIRRNDSAYLNAYFKEFNDKRDADQSILEIADTLIVEFDKMSEAARTLRTMDNTPLKEEISQWLDQFEQVGIAGSETMKMYKAIEQKDMEAAQESRNKVDAANAFMKENKRETQVGAMPVLNILIATQYVVPFIDTNFKLVNDAFYFENVNIEDMDIAVNVITYDGPNDDKPNDWVAEKAIDQKMSTKLWTAKDQAAGQEIKVTFDKVEYVHKISIYMEGNDTVKNGKLQYSLDGQDWKDLADMSETETEGSYSVVKADANGAKAKYVRVLVTGSATAWIQMNEIIFTNPNMHDPLDKTILETIYNKYKDEVESKYTVDSWTPFALALENAATILGDELAIQDSINEAKVNLQNAADALVEKAEDTTLSKAILLSTINKALIAEASEEYKVLEPSVKALITAMRIEAQRVYADASATNEQCITAQLDLDNALQSIDFTVDKTALSKLIATCELINTDDYDIGVEEFKAALIKAIEIRDDETQLQGSINIAYNNLEAARILLAKTEIKVDKSSLESTIALIKSKAGNGDKYKKDANWKTFKSVMAEAEAVMLDEAATQAEVNAIQVALTSAFGNVRLLTSEADLELLASYLKTINGIDRKNFTKEQLKLIDETTKKVNAMILDFDDKKFPSLEKEIAKTLSMINDVNEEAKPKPEVPGKEETPNTDYPQTGDVTNQAAFMFLLIMSGCGIVVIRKKRNKKV